MADNNKYDGFVRGMKTAADTLTKNEYDKSFLPALREACMNTEKRGSSYSSYYNKMYGKMALTVAETEKLNEIFNRYGITEWRGQ